MPRPGKRPGKGHNRRPSVISREQFDENWKAAFPPVCQVNMDEVRGTMSSNLCENVCHYCGEPVTLDEAARPIRECDVRPRNFEFHRGMLVALATCELCEARYIAWIDGSCRTWNDPKWGPQTYPQLTFDGVTKKGEKGPVGDLSFRSTFSDEPGPEDLPKWKIEKVRKGPWIR
jgi:hypothetical protein